MLVAISPVEILYEIQKILKLQKKQKPKSMNGKRATTPMVLTSTLLKIPLVSFTA
jgi:hypothetical protein